MLAEIARWSFVTGYGFLSLALICVRSALQSDALSSRDTDEEKRALAEAQKARWSLDREPLVGFRHAFWKTREGVGLHYVVNQGIGGGDGKARNVAIFIHGFPDSFLLWWYILLDPALKDYVLIAVDLPGYGGSDSLTSYDAASVFEPLTDFVIGMRETFLQKDRKLVMITHDWGSLIGARLASEAKGLADHWVITSGLIPHSTEASIRSYISLAKQMLSTWIRQPFNTVLLRNAVRAFGPVTSQLSRSFYVFCFGLPPPFHTFFATFGNFWFLRLIHSIGKGASQKPDANDLAEAMAMSAGPGIAQLDQIAGAGELTLKYGESVRKRVKDRGMSQKIGIYRDGLFVGKWEKSLQITAELYNLPSASSISLSSTAPKGALKAPATIILGEGDPAFEKKLILAGIRDYLVKGSQVLVFKGMGHWLPIEETGRQMLVKTIQWALSDGTGKTSLFKDMENIQIIEEL